MTKKNILITGFAGSIGQAFTAHLLHLGHRVVGVDNNEWAVASMQDHKNLDKRLQSFDTIGDPVFGWADILIHLAAYKHVNLGETNVMSFIDNNVTMTCNLFRKASKHSCNILFVSTDKAVEPISTYGFTKALGERACLSLGGSVARLGNILNSNGSVIPIWETAIANKQPIPITDERMIRYQIEAQDAVNQIWAGYEQGIQLIIPSMGEPVRIMDMLADVLARHGYAKPDDYEPGVTIIGMRPGEKISERLRWETE